MAAYRSDCLFAFACFLCLSFVRSTYSTAIKGATSFSSQRKREAQPIECKSRMLRQQPRRGLLAKNLVMLMLSSGLLTLLLLSRLTPSASALNLSPSRQFWTSLRASSDEPHEDNAEAKAGATQFERVVRRVTGSKDYKFGDITRSVATASSSVVEGTVRTVMNNDDYQFGDITKTVIGSTAHGIEGTFPLNRKYLAADHQSWSYSFR